MVVSLLPGIDVDRADVTDGGWKVSTNSIMINLQAVGIPDAS
jgi:hypothetical protein